MLAFGTYPDVSLAEARERHSQARKVLAAGNDPGEVKKEAKRLVILKSENTFEAIAREWRDSRKHKWVTSYSEAMLTRLERHVFPKLGHRPISAITAPELLSVFRVVENTGALDLAQRLMQASGQIFRYAIATGRAERNPVTDLRGALKPPVRKHQAHLTADELPLTESAVPYPAEESQRPSGSWAARTLSARGENQSVPSSSPGSRRSNAFSSE